MERENALKKESAIEVSHFSKRFEELIAVNDVSFTIPKGQIVGMLGPNGAGKTTTIRMMVGVFPLNKSAALHIFNKLINPNNRSYKKLFGIVPEISNAYRDYTVWQNISFNGSIYGLNKKQIKNRGNQLLKTFQLEDKSHFKTKNLSKGLKQRLNFCMALIHDPPILIFDEPTSGLDPISVNILRTQIKEFKKQGKTVFITTHDMNEAQRLCDRVLIMNRGRIIADEAPEVLQETFRPALNILVEFKSKISTLQAQKIIEQFPIDQHDEKLFEFSTKAVLEDIGRLQQFIQEEKIEIERIKFREATLEEIFISLIQEDEK